MHARIDERRYSGSYIEILRIKLILQTVKILPIKSVKSLELVSYTSSEKRLY